MCRHFPPSGVSPGRALAILAIGTTFWLGTHSAAAGDGPGPVAPELTSFSPLGNTELVDHFTGDFRYNVPLMEVPGPNGGYPIALTYTSGITPDQDASWVGLGFTLSPGAIVRQMRGLPDDFDGDAITTVQDIEPARTYGLGLEGNYEIFGVDSSVGTGLTAGLTGYFDSYRGFGITHTVGLSAQTKGQGTTTSIGLSLGEDTLEGASVGASASLSLNNSMTFGANATFDASRGFSALTFNVQSRYQSAPFVVPNVLGFLGYAKPAALPGTGREMDGSNIKVSFKMGGEVYGNYISGMMFGFYNEEHLRSRTTHTKAYGFLHLDKGLGALGEQAALDFNREKDGPIYDQSPNLALPVLTHDLFVVSGRDLVGTFRAYRNDVPVVFDPQEKSSLTGGAIGVDVGFGNFIKVGVTGALNHSSTTVERWNGGGLATTFLASVKGSFTPDPSFYQEQTYFKFVGEPTFSAAPVAGVGPVAPPLAPAMDRDPPFVGFQANTGTLTVTQPAERTPRANLVQAFTNGELAEMFHALPDLQRDFLAVSWINTAATAPARSERSGSPTRMACATSTASRSTTGSTRSTSSASTARCVRLERSVRRHWAVRGPSTTTRCPAPRSCSRSSPSAPTRLRIY